MIELNDFYNAGMGWICRHCERDLTPAGETPRRHSRFFSEGEAESKAPTLASLALAKWTDKTRRFLTCPRCGITEGVEKS
jgi:ribosomal protein S14